MAILSGWLREEKWRYEWTGVASAEEVLMGKTPGGMGIGCEADS